MFSVQDRCTVLSRLYINAWITMKGIFKIKKQNKKLCQYSHSCTHFYVSILGSTIMPSTSRSLKFLSTIAKSFTLYWLGLLFVMKALASKSTSCKSCLWFSLMKLTYSSLVTKLYRQFSILIEKFSFTLYGESYNCQAIVAIIELCGRGINKIRELHAQCQWKATLIRNYGKFWMTVVVWNYNI